MDGHTSDREPSRGSRAGRVSALRLGGEWDGRGCATPRPPRPTAGTARGRERHRCVTTAWSSATCTWAATSARPSSSRQFLEWAVENTRELVINGDIFDDLNFNRLSKRHFACLKIIRRNSDRDDFRLVWVRGNHDGPADVVGHIVGVEILDEYVFRNGRLRLLILHGDQFDRFVNNYGWLTEIACGLFYYIQKWAPHRAARYIRRVSKKWQRSSQLDPRRGRRLRGVEGLPPRHLRPHPPARHRACGRCALRQQRHVDRAPTLPVRVGSRGRGPAGILATRYRRGRRLGARARDGDALKRPGSPCPSRSRADPRRDPFEFGLLDYTMPPCQGHDTP